MKNTIKLYSESKSETVVLPRKPLGQIKSVNLTWDTLKSETSSVMLRMARRDTVPSIGINIIRDQPQVHYSKEVCAVFGKIVRSTTHRNIFKKGAEIFIINSDILDEGKVDLYSILKQAQSALNFTFDDLDTIENVALYRDTNISCKIKITTKWNPLVNKSLSSLSWVRGFFSTDLQCGHFISPEDGLIVKSQNFKNKVNFDVRPDPLYPNKERAKEGEAYCMLWTKKDLTAFNLKIGEDQSVMTNHRVVFHTKNEGEDNMSLQLFVYLILESGKHLVKEFFLADSVPSTIYIDWPSEETGKVKAVKTAIKYTKGDITVTIDHLSPKQIKGIERCNM